MKKFIFLLSFLIFLILPKNSIASTTFTDDEEICYSQCAAYKFVWQGDFCYDTFQNECAMGKGNTIKETIKFLKGIYGVLKDGSGVDNVFKAWFVCKPLIEQCIVPQLRECRTTCSADNLFYAPDLSVGHPYGNFVYHGVIYNERDKTLTFKVVNNGRGYAWDIGASATWGHTRNRDGLVSGGGQLFNETIPELIYAGARNGPPKTVGDYITDFLIEESNFSQYLQGFKSDADNYDVPAIWYKTIPFTPPPGELTKVIFNVDPNQMIKERSETNNTFILTIDNLPTPPSFRIENFSQKLEANQLNNFLIDFDVKNSGEENGEMTVKIFDGKYNGSNNQAAIWENTQVVQGLNKFNFSTFINPDVINSRYCGENKSYEIVIFDKGKKVDNREFSLPLYSGSIRGSIEDLFGKNVEGATITASNGQSTTTNKYGNYYLKGINQLGKVIITVTHPELSKTEIREINFKMGDGLNPCDEGNLTFTGINFVLKDQDVMFTVTVKDRSGNLIPSHVLASNENWRFEQDITDSLTPMPGMQPGEYFFTISANGYKTIGQTVNAVPNNQNLEFVMELLNGRLTDGGLNILTSPQLLWEMNRGEEILANITASKDGNLVVLYTTRNKLDSGKLYLLDSLIGNQRNVVSTIATAGNSQASLDCSYDGNTTALYVHHGTFGITKDSQNVLKLFNNQGSSIGEKILKSKSSATLCEVSPDGFYIYPFQLMNKGLYEYTRFDIFGTKDSKESATYVSNEALHFLTNNNIVAGCPKGSGQCVQTINKTEIVNLGQTDSTRQIDSSQDGNKIGIVTVEKAFLFSNGAKTWEKDVITRGDPLSISVTPGGKFVIYSTNVEEKHGRIFKIFTDNNIDKTFFAPKTNEDVVFVHANDKGIFYLAQDGKILKYYQAASYSIDYNPVTPLPTSGGQERINSLSYYENGTWQSAGSTSWADLLWGKIYMAHQNVNLALPNNLGSLQIKEGTLFALDDGDTPILLKGQMTADFSSPLQIIAIKFDRYDMNLFQNKLNDFRQGNLNSSEYFVVKNIHTKFIVKNEENNFKVAVMNGEVEVRGKDLTEKIENGKQITIDQNNKVKKSVYFGWKIYAIISGILVLIISALFYKYRKTKVGGKIIEIGKKMTVLAWKYFKVLVIWIWKMLKIILIWFWKMVKKVVPILWKWIKKGWQLITNSVNKVLKKKK